MYGRAAQVGFYCRRDEKTTGGSRASREDDASGHAALEQCERPGTIEECDAQHDEDDWESGGLKRIWRLLLYVRPYALYSLTSVVLMAIVGAMAAFRVLLVKPIFDNVLRPDAVSHDVLVFHVPHLDWVLNLQFLVPSHLHNAWNVVAYALVVSALLKSVCDYAGTYLINYAGFGMITDLRNDLYNAVLRRSVAFFQKHTTGSLLSTLINDIERVQF